MPEHQLFYYTELSKPVDPLLGQLPVSFVDSKDNRGFSLRLRHYGQNIEKYLTDQLGHEDEGYLIWKPLNLEQQIKLNHRIHLNPLMNVYILAHRLVGLQDLIHLLLGMGLNDKNLKLLSSDDPLMFQPNELMWGQLAQFKLNRIILRSNAPVQIKKNASGFVMPFAVMTLIKVILSPLVELKRFYSALKVSQFVAAKRLFELFAFILFLIYTLISKLYYGFKFVFGKSLIGIIPAYFKIRHFALMTCFKGYGLAVDFYYKARAFYDKARDFCMYLVAGSVRVYWIVRFPFFKIYWFCRYQYHTRLKKKIWTE